MPCFSQLFSSMSMHPAVSVLPCCPPSHLSHPSRVSDTLVAWMNETFADRSIHLYAWHLRLLHSSALFIQPPRAPAGCAVRVLSHRGPAPCRPPVQVRGPHLGVGGAPCRSTAAPRGTGPSTRHRSLGVRGRPSRRGEEPPGQPLLCSQAVGTPWVTPRSHLL